MKTTLFSFISAAALLCAAGCKTAPAPVATPPGATPVIVHVADFSIGLESIQHEDGLISSRPGPVGAIGKRLAGTSSDPSARARELVDLMADSLVKDLKESGFSAHRVSGGPLPSEGWFLRGAFTEVQEGNRVRRALIGLGEGQTDVQVIASLTDLKQGRPQPLYEVAAAAGSGSGLGAAPTLIVGPYGAAARFVLAGGDLEKNVKNTAARITQAVTTHIRQHPAP